jgi:hypothetical protein
MKIFFAAFLLAALPRRGDARALSGNIVNGDIDIGVFAKCAEYLDSEGVTQEGETVEGDCEFSVDARRLLQETNLRSRNLSHDDEDFFLTLENCDLEGDISGNSYTIIDGVTNYQETVLEQEINTGEVDESGDEIFCDLETTYRSIHDQVFLLDEDDLVVATGTKTTYITIEEGCGNDAFLKSMDDLTIEWDVELCEIQKGFVPEGGFIFENDP